MGILDGLKRTLNIGGCLLTIRTDGISYRQGAIIQGEVTVRGGTMDQTAKTLTILLEEYWTESRGSGKNRRTETVYKTRDSRLLRENLTILPGGELSNSFTLTLPLNSRLSTSATGWRLKAVMDIPMAVDPATTLILKVGEAPELRAIVDACEQRLDFTEKKNSWRWTQDGYTSVRLLPTEVMKAEFDHFDLSLALTNRNGTVGGRVTFNLQEKSFKDYFKALVGKDRVTKDVQWTRAQIFLPDGAVNSEAIGQQIAPMIAEIIAQRQQQLYPQAIGGKPSAASSAPSAPAARKKAKVKEFDPKSLDN